MAAFCHFWQMSPPEFWDLDIREYQAMLRLMEKVKEENDRDRRRRNRR